MTTMTEQEAIRVLRDQMQKIADTSAMDYEYRKWASNALAATASIQPVAAPAQSLTHQQIAEHIDRPGFWLDTLNPAEQRNLLASIAELLAAAPAQVAPEAELFRIESLIAKYHGEVWEVAQSDTPDYDYAGRETAKELVKAIRSIVVPSAPAQAAPDKVLHNNEYTCIGKGGSYRLLGLATGAGTSRGQPDVRVYMEADNPLALYYRTVADFDARMQRTTQAATTADSQKDCAA